MLRIISSIILVVEIPHALTWLQELASGKELEITNSWKKGSCSTDHVSQQDLLTCIVPLITVIGSHLTRKKLRIRGASTKAVDVSALNDLRAL